MSNFFKSLLPYAAGALGSGVSSQFSALAPFSAAIGAGAGALSDLKNPLGGAAAGFAGGGVGSTLAGGVKGLFNGGSGGALNNFGSGAFSGLQSYGNSIPGFGGIGTSNPTGMFAKFFSPSGGSPNGVNLNNSTNFAMSPNGGGVGSSLAGFGGGGGGNPSPTGSLYPSSGGNTGLGFNLGSLNNTTSNAGTTPAASGMSPMNMFKNMIPGLAVSGIGGLIGGNTKAPDYSGLISQLEAQNTAGTPDRQAAEAQYLSTINAPTGASAESGVANAKLINDRQKAQAVKELQDQFTANNGSLTGNSAYNDALAKTNAQYDQNYSAQAAQTQFQYDNQQQQNKLAAADALSKMDATQQQFMASIAGLSAQQISDKYNVDAGHAQAIANIASQAGAFMMQKSLGLGGGK